MALVVSEEVRLSATDCRKDFGCLAGDGTDLCRVTDCIAGQVHFIECRSEGYCSYQQAFGDAALCGCPVRKELYRIYRV
ncbi:MAG: hypothetical protein OEO20_14665 [Gemmatimonadota bacterium]|nr:hypothetical protein [Gemmatimonadota bacterium]MDH3366877.1 hypothetical protein [Gemmatimonadota bacterium]MDH3479537.1 hypothetical protein [Gemmatimonadota bacterium]MDH3568731.1 hypothetical protein [Gemmatimonadota bacterium]